MRIGMFIDSVSTACSDGISYITSGGIGVYAQELLLALLEEEEDNEYLLLRGRPASVPLISHPRVKEVSPSRPWRFVNRTGVWREWVLGSEPIDLLHELTPVAGTIRWHKYPLVLTVHDVIPLLYPELFHTLNTYAFKAFCRHNLERAEAVIAVSQNTNRDMQRFFPAAGSKTTVIPIAGQTFKASPPPNFDVRQQFNIHKPYLLSVATIEPRKNHLALLDAYRLVRESGYDLQLVLIGPKGWKNDNIYSHETLYKYKQDIVFTGVIPPRLLEMFYREALVFIYPSFYEGFGMPALEAAGAGIPVIVGRNSSLVEVMGDSPYYVSERPGGREIADGVIEIIGNPELKKQLSIRGKKQTAGFSWQKTARQTLQVYRQAARRAPR